MSPDIVEYCDEIADNFLISYDCDDKKVAVELYCISNLLHVFGPQGMPCFTIDPIYYKDLDILKINFVNFTPPVIKFKKTDEKDIEIGVDDAEKVVNILFYNASNRILKTLSEEERINRKKKR
ncbi:hypothetical protein RclHR1_11800004 [Rhizophagus clarus]|nr:hypothetical protein RclHR1_11800004 [Rhizophagus clarus]